MFVKKAVKQIAWANIFCLALSACTPKPPFNNFKKEPVNVKPSITGAGLGAITGTLLGSTGIGAAVGVTAGTMVGIYRANKRNIINQLQKQNIQYVEYGDTMTLIIPTDQYFEFNSPNLNDVCYAGLNNIIRLLKFYSCSRVYVAAFTDDVGPTVHKNQMSQAQAEAMLTFLWAHDIPAKLLRAEGYGEKNPIADNHWIRGSAYNRRIEIQWFNVPDTPPKIAPEGMK